MKPRSGSSWLAAAAVVLCAWTAAAQAAGEVAVVNGKRITLAEVDEALALFALEAQAYALRKNALDQLIVRMLLEDEAKRRAVTPEQLRAELTAAAVRISDSEVERTYEENASALRSMNADEARERLRLDLESQERMRRYVAAVAKLRAAAEVEVLLEEPRVPLSPVEAATAKGAAGAPVVVSVFSDFLCTHCRAARGTLEELLARYPDAVRLSYRHLPLQEGSTQLAQAAVCAAEQGRFWAFHDLAFASPPGSAEAVRAVAARASLDGGALERCVASGSAVRTIERRAGRAAGRHRGHARIHRQRPRHSRRGVGRRAGRRRRTGARHFEREGSLVRHLRLVVTLAVMLVAATAFADGREPLASFRVDRAGLADLQLVRAAYARFTAFERASRAQELGEESAWLADAVALRFELRDFRTGRVGEILGRPYTELVTLPSGDIISASRAVHQELEGAETVSYSAQWTAGSYASGNDPLWSVGQVFAFEPEKYHDVSRYVTYEVAVSFDGRSRTYRALALVHDLYGSADAPWLEVWDTVAGFGGTLTAIAADVRPPTAPRPALAHANRPGIVAQAYGPGSPVPWHDFNTVDHMDSAGARALLPGGAR